MLRVMRRIHQFNNRKTLTKLNPIMIIIARMRTRELINTNKNKNKMTGTKSQLRRKNKEVDVIRKYNNKIMRLYNKFKRNNKKKTKINPNGTWKKSKRNNPTKMKVSGYNKTHLNKLKEVVKML